MAASSGVLSEQNRAIHSSKKEPIPISETRIICSRFSVMFKITGDFGREESDFTESEGESG